LRILLSWLRDFVEVPAGPAELGDMLSMRGFEVAAIEDAPPGPLAPPETADQARREKADAVLDLEITANRPDCLSVYGIAREVATAYGLPLQPIPERDVPTASTGASGRLGDLALTIEDPELCPRYAAGRASVKVGPSPEWLANRLVAGGVRPINNVVDVSNYVLLELGHPTHAFDFERLGGRELRARRGRPGEQITTLDGERRTVDDEMLVIADRVRPQAIAGVMGGADSEVWSGTRGIAFESAFFKPASVRRTSRRLGLTTEASYRFERGADIGGPVTAMRRAWTWLARIGAGTPVDSILDCYPGQPEPTAVLLRDRRMTEILGQAVDPATVAAILTRLGFGAEPVRGGWMVAVPSWRIDVRREADLIEEVARHYGYDRLPTTFPPLVTFPPPEDPRLARDRTIRRVLTAGGFSEAQTLTFIEAPAARPFAAGEPVALAYPLSEKFAVLRPSLLPGLVEAIAHNRRRQHPDVRLFEVGARFSPDRGEHAAVGLGWTGAARPEHWSGTGRAVDFFDMKGVVERLLEALGVAARWVPASPPALVEGRAAAVVCGDVALGVAGQLAPGPAAARDLPASDPVYLAELDLDAVSRVARPDLIHVQPLPRHPSVVRDVSIIVDETLPAEAVRGTIVAAAPATLIGLAEFDRYRGPGIPEGRVSLSFRLTFRAPDRTLTDAEVDRAMEIVVDTLAERHQAVRR
jgi:phenylalanyl-tRNA synthetase beta chain